MYCNTKFAPLSIHSRTGQSPDGSSNSLHQSIGASRQVRIVCVHLVIRSPIYITLALARKSAAHDSFKPSAKVQCPGDQAAFHNCASAEMRARDECTREKSLSLVQSASSDRSHGGDRSEVAHTPTLSSITYSSRFFVPRICVYGEGEREKGFSENEKI